MLFPQQACVLGGGKGRMQVDVCGLVGHVRFDSEERVPTKDAHFLETDMEQQASEIVGI